MVVRPPDGTEDHGVVSGFSGLARLHSKDQCGEEKKREEKDEEDLRN
jgi:hypothetical protein